MKYYQFKIIMKNKQNIIPYDCATGGGTDSTVDTGAILDPNQYLAPRADGKMNIIEWLVIIGLIVGIALVCVSLVKQTKSLSV